MSSRGHEGIPKKKFYQVTLFSFVIRKRWIDWETLPVATLRLKGLWPKHAWYLTTKIKRRELDSNAAGWLPGQFSQSPKGQRQAGEYVQIASWRTQPSALAAPTVSCRDLDADLENMLSQFSKDMKPGGLVNTLDTKRKTQSDAREPEKKFSQEGM